MARLLLRLGPFALLAGLVAAAWLALLRRFALANSSPAPDPSRARRLVEAITIGAQWFLALLFGLAAIPQEKGPGLALVGVGLPCPSRRTDGSSCRA